MSLFFINQTYLTLLAYLEAAIIRDFPCIPRNKSFYHKKFKPGCRIVRKDSKMSNINALMCTFGGGGGWEGRDKEPTTE